MVGQRGTKSISQSCLILRTMHISAQHQHSHKFRVKHIDHHRLPLGRQLHSSRGLGTGEVGEGQNARLRRGSGRGPRPENAKLSSLFNAQRRHALRFATATIETKRF